MPIATEPTGEYDWARNTVNNGPIGGPNKVEPPTQYKDEGFYWDQKSPYEVFNGWAHNVQLWFDYMTTVFTEYDGNFTSFQSQIDTINNVTIPSISETTSESFLIGKGTTNQNLKYFRAANDLDETGSYIGLKYDGGSWGWVAKNDTADTEYSLDPSTYGFQDQAGVETIADQRIALDTGVQYILLQDQKVAGTDGGNTSASTWQTRDLNTEVTDTGGDCTLSSNQFTLAEGEYELEASVPAFSTGGTKSRLVEDPGGADNIIAVSNNLGLFNNEGRMGYTFIYAYLDVPPGGQTFEIQMKSQLATTNGMGRQNFLAETEIYTSVKIKKLRA